MIAQFDREPILNRQTARGKHVEFSQLAEKVSEIHRNPMSSFTFSIQL